VSLDPRAAAVADDALRGLIDALAERDVDRVLPLFSDNASLFGSEDREFAIGKPALRAFLTELCSQPQVARWEWQVTAAGCDGDVVWFVAPGAAILTGDDGSETRIEPYRLSGVLRSSADGWIFELFTGSEPTAPA
jgi:ketosteroid isomerase-like protein